MGRYSSTNLHQEPPTELFPLGTNPQLTRFGQKPSEFRVASDVLNGPPEVLFVADNSVKRFFLPKIASTPFQFIDSARGEALPASQNGFKGMMFRIEWAKHHMNVIRHHDVGVQLIARLKRISGDLWFIGEAGRVGVPSS